MSRYRNNYQSIKSKIELIRNTIDEINIQDILDENNKIEFLRYNKNFSILEDIVENIEPDFLNGNIQGFLNSSQESLSSLNHFKSNNTNSQYIIEANNKLDSMSSFVRPYILHRKRLKNSLAKAIEEYIDSVEEHLHNLNEFKDELEKAKKYTNDIQEYYNTVLDEDDKESIKSQINTAFEDIENKKSKIYEFYNELLSDGEYTSIKTEVADAREEINSTKKEVKSIQKEIENIFTDSSNTLGELKEFYVKIFGEVDGGTKERIGGLQEEIQKRFKEIDDFENRHQTLLDKHKKKYEEMVKEINSLLPGATSIGLAKTYTYNREKFEKQTRFWNRFFIGIMVTIFLFGFYLVVENLTIDIQHILKYSPIYISVIWLALFASKRRNESMRLEQEYTHKETLAKSYMSYKEQIENLANNEKNELLQKLLKSTMATISQNPNHVLDKNNTDNHPVMEFIDSIWKRDKS